MKFGKKKPWFTKIRGSYLPKAWQGQVIYGGYLVYVVAVPVVWYIQGHELWQLLVNVLPALVGAAIITQYVASKNS